MDFFVHVNEKKKIREIITVYAPVNGKVHSILLYIEPAPAFNFWNSVIFPIIYEIILLTLTLTG